MRQQIVQAGVVVDAIDAGGGFPARYGEAEPAPLADFFKVIAENFESLPVSHDCRLICEPGRALVAEAESLIVRVDARRGNELFINDGGYGALFDAAQLDFRFPVRQANRHVAPDEHLTAFQFWGPTCDSIDHMKGPFMLPSSIGEGDYIEIGNIGAYGRAIAGGFNGYGCYTESSSTTSRCTPCSPPTPRPSAARPEGETSWQLCPSPSQHPSTASRTPTATASMRPQDAGAIVIPFGLEASVSYGSGTIPRPRRDSGGQPAARTLR